MTDASRPKFSNPRWEQLLRYRYIELIALWEGRLTTRQLCETFGIGRQQANKDLTSYRRGLIEATWFMTPSRSTTPLPKTLRPR